MTKPLDITGQRFGRLTAIERVGHNSKGRSLWRCLCDCGNEKVVMITDLTHGMTSSCGCYRREFRKIDLTGQKFNHLTVLGVDDGEHSHPGQYWRCQCDCGKIIVVRGDGLKSGHAKSCGCVNPRKTTHNLTNTRLHRTWNAMKQRCLNDHNFRYKDYGGRGIKVCQEWENDFMSFYNWSMENGYDDSLTIDRIDNDGNYCPENCRWTTQAQQCLNRRNTVYITYNGETKNIKEWSAITGLKESTISSRRLKGWDAERILQPLCKKTALANGV